MTLWESMTKNEQRFIRGLAVSETPPKPFSSDFTRQYGLRSASNAQRAAESLVASAVIEREDSSYVINDRFLRLWIRSAHLLTAHRSYLQRDWGANPSISRALSMA